MRPERVDFAEGWYAGFYDVAHYLHAGWYRLAYHVPHSLCGVSMRPTPVTPQHRQCKQCQKILAKRLHK